jgi:hypothetical protein
MTAAAVLLRAPLLGCPAESAKVPRCDEEVAVEVPGRDRLVQGGGEEPEGFGEVLRKRIGDLRRDPESYPDAGGISMRMDR